MGERAIGLRPEKESTVELVCLYRIRSVALTHVSDIEPLALTEPFAYNVRPRNWVVIPRSDTLRDPASCDWQENILPFH